MRSDEQANYAKCANDECNYKGFSFRPAADAVGERVCPSCLKPLETWKEQPEDADGRRIGIDNSGHERGERD